jgi:hypothetical protein
LCSHHAVHSFLAQQGNVAALVQTMRESIGLVRFSFKRINFSIVENMVNSIEKSGRAALNRRDELCLCMVEICFTEEI